MVWGRELFCDSDSPNRVPIFESFEQKKKKEKRKKKKEKRKKKKEDEIKKESISKS